MEAKKAAVALTLACFSLQHVRDEVCSALARDRGIAERSTWSEEKQDCLDQVTGNVGASVLGEKRLVLRTKRKREPSGPPISFRDYAPPRIYQSSIGED